MPLLPDGLERLTQELGRLPGVGPKTAQRLALHVVGWAPEQSRRLEQALAEVRDGVGRCAACGFIAESGHRCAICRAAGRDAGLVCVVAGATDVLAIERSGGYRGLYHVLGGTLSPIDGVGPDSLRVDGLITRVREGGVREVIVATDADVEGEATASYLASVLGPLGVILTRPAHGLPVGGELAYADERTVAQALSGRRPV
ncbi:MAG TPA: recombination mediator RecR [Candidatus Micrarchaeia archaeon]|nr:recombination mediator RecR [Candidatus Micrarchaeia archaeon]